MEVARLVAKVTADTSQAQRNLKDFSGQLDRTATQGQAAGRTMQSALAGFAGGAAFAGLTAVTNLLGNGLTWAMSAAGDAAIGLNSRLEQSEIGFTTMLGSGEEAKAFLDDLASFAAKTPFEFEGLTTASQRMLAFGFEAEKVLPLLEDIGDAAAAMGGGSESIDRITRALGQMQAKGRVMSEELLQLTEVGIPALQLLADELGTTTAEAQRMVTAGEVSADQFIAAFQRFSDANFGGMMQAQARTFSGAMETIADSLNLAIARGAEPFFERLSSLAVQIADFTASDDFDQWANRFATASERAFTAGERLGEVGGEILSALEPVRELAPLMTTVAGVTVGATQAMAGGWLMLTANMITGARVAAESIGILGDVAAVLSGEKSPIAAAGSIKDHFVDIGRAAIDSGQMTQQGAQLMWDALGTGQATTAGLNSLLGDLAAGTRTLTEEQLLASEHVAIAEATLRSYGEAVQEVAGINVMAAVGAHELGAAVLEAESNLSALTATQDAWAKLQADFQLGIDHASAGMGAWEQDLGEVEKAIKILQERQEQGLITQEELDRLDFLSGTALPRVEAGISEMGVAYSEQVELQERLRLAQDEYNAAVARGDENVDQYAQKVRDIAGDLDPVAGLTMDWVESNNNLVTGLEGVIGKLRDLLTDAGLLEDLDPTVTVDSDLQAWRDGMAEVEAKELADKQQRILVHREEWTEAYQDIEASEITPKTGDFGADIGDWELKYAAVEEATITEKIALISGDNLDAMTKIFEVQDSTTPDKTQIILGDNTVAIQVIQEVNGMNVPDKTFTITPYVDLSQFNSAIQYIDDNIPHSPAKIGPLSREPNWQWLFAGIGDAAREQFKDAENEMELFAQHMELFEIWDFVFGNFEDIVTGDKIQELNELGRLLSVQLAAAIEREAPPEIIAGFEAALAAVRQQTNAAMALAGTEAAQAWAEAFAEEQQQAARFDWWMDTIPNLDQIIADGNIDRFEDQAEAARRRLEFARESGASADVLKQLEQDLAVAENNVRVAGSMLAMAIREGWIESIEPMTDEVVAQIIQTRDQMNKAAAGTGTDFVESLLDEVVDGLFSGRVDLEQALEIIPRELVDALEQMEEQLTVKLFEAMLAGADNVDVLNEQLRILAELLDGVRDSAQAATLAVGTFVPGRGYYYSQGIYTTGGNGSNLSTMGSNFQTFGEHNEQPRVNVYGNITVNTTTSPSITELLDGVMPA